MKASIVPLSIGVATLLGCGAAEAGGISLYEVGSADVGLASAGFSARAQDASTIFTNPAGMTRLSGNQLTLGTQLLYGDLGFSIDQGTTPALGSNDGGNPVGWLPGGGLFYSHSISDDLKVGVAVTGNFGSVIEYDPAWVGRYRAQEGTLIGYSLLPTIAWRVNDKLSVGASLHAMYGTFDNKVAINNIFGPDGRLLLEDTQWAFGANLGLLYEVDEGTRFGLTYKSSIKLDFQSRTKWEGLDPLIGALLRSQGLLDVNVDLGATVPQEVDASFYHETGPRWAILGSVGWQQWSKFGEVEVGVDTNNPIALTTQLDFDDTWRIAGGVQYKLSDSWLLNAGIAHDSGFQDSDNVALSLPVNSAWRFGIGGQKQQSETLNWGWSLEYLAGGTIKTNISGSVPVILGGRGNVVGSFDDGQFIFLAANFNWKL